jgi:hypothetical protein
MMPISESKNDANPGVQTFVVPQFYAAGTVESAERVQSNLSKRDPLSGLLSKRGNFFFLCNTISIQFTMVKRDSTL